MYNIATVNLKDSWNTRNLKVHTQGIAMERSEGNSSTTGTRSSVDDVLLACNQIKQQHLVQRIHSFGGEPSN